MASIVLCLMMFVGREMITTCRKAVNTATVTVNNTVTLRTTNQACTANRNSSTPMNIQHLLRMQAGLVRPRWLAVMPCMAVLDLLSLLRLNKVSALPLAA